MSTDVLTQALALSRRGLSVIPVPRPDPATGRDGKVPAIAWREYQTRRPTEDEIRIWFGGPPVNIAVVTGAVSGVVVIDADSLAALRWCTRRLPYTPWQTRTSRGYHLWYRHPGARVPNRARVQTADGRLAIDVRGDGGYVIAPGSVHATTTNYAEAGDWREPLEALPRLWLGWLERPRLGAPSRAGWSPSTSSDVLARARAYLASIPLPQIGHGSDAATLYAACRLVRGFALGPAEATELLWDWAGGRPGWSREWIARKVAHAERYGSEPVGALR